MVLQTSSCKPISSIFNWLQCGTLTRTDKPDIHALRSDLVGSFVRYFIFSAIVVLIIGCGEIESDPRYAPYRKDIPKALKGELEKIMDLPPAQRFSKQVALLKKIGHEIVWFQRGAGYPEVVRHDTVQMINFGTGQDGIGYCSGNIVGNRYIATAGHCLEHKKGVPPTVPRSCEGDILFAYRASNWGGLRYFPCKKILESQYRDTNVYGSEVYDYALIEIEPLADRKPEITSSMTSPRKHFNTSKTVYSEVKADFDSKADGQLALALVVDPPEKSAVGHTSAYDLVLATFESTSGCTRNRCLAMKYTGPRNPIQQGNSGAPVYWIESTRRETDFPRGLGLGPPYRSIDLDESQYIYVAPVYAIPSVENDRFLVSFPHRVLTELRKSLGF